MHDLREFQDGPILKAIVFCPRNHGSRRHLAGGDPSRELTPQSEDPYDCRRATHTYTSGGGGNYLCQEKMCGGQDVSEYTHVWNLQPTTLCGPEHTTLHRISAPKNSSALNTFSGTIGSRDKLAYMELDSNGHELKQQS
jgi:hypothetical protein